MGSTQVRCWLASISTRTPVSFMSTSTFCVTKQFIQLVPEASLAETPVQMYYKLEVIISSLKEQGL